MTMQSKDASGSLEVAGWTWRVDPPEDWLVIPATGLDGPDNVARWERGVPVVVRESFDPVPDESGVRVELDDDARAGLDQLAADSVVNLRAFADGMAPAGHRVVGALGVLGRGPVPVLVAVGVSVPGAPGDALMEALGATGGHPAGPPNVEHLVLPEGDGVRVVRLDLDDETGTVWMTVTVGRRVEHTDAVVDTVLVWRTVDLLLGAAMVGRLDELLPAVRIERSGT
jgi:hypothetical protein